MRGPSVNDHTKPLARAEWREVVRLRAVGCSTLTIATRLRMRRATIDAILRHPDAVRHMGRLQDQLDAEAVKAATYSPWVDLLAEVVEHPRRRRRTLSKGKPPPASADGGGFW